jgi:hypothetical protein
MQQTAFEFHALQPLNAAFLQAFRAQNADRVADAAANKESRI